MSRLHDIPETAVILDVSRVTVYRLIANGDLESCDVAPSGSRRPKTRVSDAAIDAFIKARTRNTKRLRSA
jgi:excisionase family DNA binding protein